MNGMCDSADKMIMWTVYMIDVGLTIWAMVKGHQLYEHRTIQNNMHYKDWLSELWATVLTVGLINIISGILLGFYFSVLKHESTKTSNSKKYTSAEAQTCRGVHIDGSSKSMEAMWKTLIIVFGALPYLLFFYVIGTIRTTRALTSNTLHYIIDDIDMLWWIVGGVILCKVIELYIGHCWAVLRTRCLKDAAMMQ